MANGKRMDHGSGAGEGTFVLRLYIAGNTANTTRAVTNLRIFCEAHLAGRYDLKIVDIVQHPELAIQEQMLGLPTLVKLSPGTVRRFIGDMSDTARLLNGLGLEQV